MFPPFQENSHRAVLPLYALFSFFSTLSFLEQVDTPFLACYARYVTRRGGIDTRVYTPHVEVGVTPESPQRPLF